MAESSNNRKIIVEPSDFDKETVGVPAVFAKDGAILARSGDIAVAFGKQHKNVLQKIDGLIADAPELRGLNFKPTFDDVSGPNGAVRSERSFEMDRKGFSLLAMRFTGYKALQWQIAYVDAFDQMEKALHGGQEPGVVHDIDRRTMNALGGMVKGIVGKALAELVPAMVNAELLNTQAAVSRGLTAGEVVEAAGVVNRKGLRGLPRQVSDKLRRFHSERGAPVPIGRLGSTTAYVFNGSLAREWLLEGGGKQFIQRVAEEKRGQGALKLVAPRIS